MNKSTIPRQSYPNSINTLSGEPRAGDAERAAQYATELAIQFAALPMAIFADLRAGKLTYRDVCFYCYLIAKGGRDGCSHWSVESLSLLTGIDGTGVKECLRHLLKAGHIAREKGFLSSHTFCLTRLDQEKRVILIKGDSAAKFLDNQPSPRLKRSRAHPSPTRYSVKKSSDTTLETSSVDELDKEMDEHFASLKLNLCPESKEEYDFRMRWERKKPQYRT